MKLFTLLSFILCAQSYATVTMQCRHYKSKNEFFEFSLTLNNVGSIRGDISAHASTDWIKTDDEKDATFIFSNDDLISYYVGEDFRTKLKEIQLEVTSSDTQNTQLKVQATEGMTCTSEAYGSDSTCYHLRYFLVAKKTEDNQRGIDYSVENKSLVCNFPN